MSVILVLVSEQSRTVFEHADVDFNLTDIVGIWHGAALFTSTTGQVYEADRFEELIMNTRILVFHSCIASASFSTATVSDEFISYVESDILKILSFK